SLSLLSLLIMPPPPPSPFFPYPTLFRSEAALACPTATRRTFRALCLRFAIRISAVSPTSSGCRPAATLGPTPPPDDVGETAEIRSEEHTSELQSLTNIVCRPLLQKQTPT